MSKSGRVAFTLIEVLIVVVIMAVLAATILPRFTNVTGDAKESSLKANLQGVRAQIELYRFDHNGNPPTAAKFVQQMTLHTSSSGEPAAAADANHSFGPYLVSMPMNAFNGSSGVASCSGKPAAEAADAGWQYDEVAGKIYANTTGHFDL